MYDTVGDLGWSVSVGNHAIEKVVEEVVGKYESVPRCEEVEGCEDCEGWDSVAQG